MDAEEDVDDKMFEEGLYTLKDSEESDHYQKMIKLIEEAHEERVKNEKKCYNL